MKIKKEFIGSVIYKGRARIYLNEVVDEVTMKRLMAEYPQYLEEIKPKKKKSDATS
tara:strand:+ start:598 stop:765 length:168 start_codon:yes stop_codon:yes gene_type:complete